MALPCSRCRPAPSEPGRDGGAAALNDLAVLAPHLAGRGEHRRRLPRPGRRRLDLDRHDRGPDGIAAFAALCRVYGQPWPDTLTVATPHNGLHLYLAA